jgi:chlorobactene glucosyltransferase
MFLSLFFLIFSATLASSLLLLMLLIALHNARYFPHLVQMTENQGNNPDRQPGYPPLSILIPARNEEEIISQSVQALLAQPYSTFELIVLDDHSSDATTQVATDAAGGDPRFRLVMGATLPKGWNGKNWACHQLALLARHKTLLFTDADVQWRPGALPALMTLQQNTQADLLTVWPTQITQSWSERLVVPLMSFAVLAYLPIVFAHRSSHPLAAAANGQCLLFQRRAYMTCGGHAAVRDQVLEDVRRAQRVKAAGLRLYMADGAGLIACRMYGSWPEVLQGYAKNILAGHGASVGLLLLSTLFHLWLFVGPWVWLVAGSAGFARYAWPWWPATIIVLGILVRGMTAYSTGQRIYDSLWMPLSVLLMTRIALQAIWWQVRYGGPQWKGRNLGKAYDK